MASLTQAETKEGYGLDHVLTNTEFETSQQKRAIQTEEEKIEAYKKELEEKEREVEELSRSAADLSDRLNLTQRNLQQNRDNCNSLKHTVTVLDEHLEALKRTHLSQVQEKKQKCQEYEQALKKYTDRWQKYQSTYSSYSKAQKLTARLEDLQDMKVHEGSLDAQITALHSTLSGMEVNEPSKMIEWVVQIATIQTQTTSLLSLLHSTESAVNETHANISDLRASLFKIQEEREKEEEEEEKKRWKEMEEEEEEERKRQEEEEEEDKGKGRERKEEGEQMEVEGSVGERFPVDGVPSTYHQQYHPPPFLSPHSNTTSSSTTSSSSSSLSHNPSPPAPSSACQRSNELSTTPFSVPHIPSPHLFSLPAQNTVGSPGNTAAVITTHNTNEQGTDISTTNVSTGYQDSNTSSHTATKVAATHPSVTAANASSSRVPSQSGSVSTALHSPAVPSHGRSIATWPPLIKMPPPPAFKKETSSSSHPPTNTTATITGAVDLSLARSPEIPRFSSTAGRTPIPTPTQSSSVAATSKEKRKTQTFPTSSFSSNSLFPTSASTTADVESDLIKPSRGPQTQKLSTGTTPHLQFPVLHTPSRSTPPHFSAREKIQTSPRQMRAEANQPQSISFNPPQFFSHPLPVQPSTAAAKRASAPSVRQTHQPVFSSRASSSDLPSQLSDPCQETMELARGRGGGGGKGRGAEVGQGVRGGPTGTSHSIPPSLRDPGLPGSAGRKESSRSPATLVPASSHFSSSSSTFQPSQEGRRHTTSDEVTPQSQSATLPHTSHKPHPPSSTSSSSLSQPPFNMLPSQVSETSAAMDLSFDFGAGGGYGEQSMDQDCSIYEHNGMYYRRGSDGELVPFVPPIDDVSLDMSQNEPFFTVDDPSTPTPATGGGDGVFGFGLTSQQENNSNSSDQIQNFFKSFEAASSSHRGRRGTGIFSFGSDAEKTSGGFSLF